MSESDKINLLSERLKTAMFYADYKAYCEKNVKEVNPDYLNEMDRAYYDYRKLNLARVSRLEKVYKPSDSALSVISKINFNQTWLVITEDWCGDSAQTLPVIAALASLNDKTKLTIILRDSNPDIMDLYLTKGKRSIPKLVVLDDNLNEIIVWGPRPEAAKALVEDLTAKGMNKQEITKELHLWYAKDGGYSTEKEIIQLLDLSLRKYSDQMSGSDLTI